MDKILIDFIKNELPKEYKSNDAKSVCYDIAKFLEKADYGLLETNNTYVFTTEKDNYKIYAPNFESAYRRFLKLIWNEG